MLLLCFSTRKCSPINVYQIVSKLHIVVKRKRIHPLDQKQNGVRTVCCSSWMVLTTPGGHRYPWWSHGTHPCLFPLQRWFIDVMEKFRSSWKLTCPRGEKENVFFSQEAGYDVKTFKNLYSSDFSNRRCLILPYMTLFQSESIEQREKRNISNTF